jgi:hypothetical protein
MSIEARVEQFHTDAQRPLDNKTEKDVSKLQKFLFRNQEYRFTEREQSHLFQAVQLYVTKYSESTAEVNPAQLLLEDALKMPFTVFTTSHKKSMLKWMDKLAAHGGGLEGQIDHGTKASYEVIDCRGATATLMSADGETRDVQLQDLPHHVQQGIVAGMQADLLVEVEHSDACGWSLKAH